MEFIQSLNRYEMISLQRRVKRRHYLWSMLQCYHSRNKTIFITKLQKRIAGFQAVELYKITEIYSNISHVYKVIRRNIVIINHKLRIKNENIFTVFTDNSKFDIYESLKWKRIRNLTGIICFFCLAIVLFNLLNVFIVFLHCVLTD